MPLFADARQRTIRIDVDDYEATAHFAGKQIGEVTTTGLIEVDDRTPEMPAVITGMFVDDAFQRAGIAMEMLRLLSQELGTLAPARRNEGRGGENALTAEGEALTRAAQAQGYIHAFPEEGIDDDGMEPH